MITNLDPLNNDFPSGHVSLSVSALLIFATAGISYKRFSYFLGAAAVAIVFGVLYLGIHWPADVFAGLLAGILAGTVARVERVQMRIDKWVRTLSERILRHEDEGLRSA